MARSVNKKTDNQSTKYETSDKHAKIPGLTPRFAFKKSHKNQYPSDYTKDVISPQKSQNNNNIQFPELPKPEEIDNTLCSEDLEPIINQLKINKNNDHFVVPKTSKNNKSPLFLLPKPDSEIIDTGRTLDDLKRNINHLKLAKNSQHITKFR